MGMMSWSLIGLTQGDLCPTFLRRKSKTISGSSKYGKKKTAFWSVFSGEFWHTFCTWKIQVYLIEACRKENHVETETIWNYHCKDKRVDSNTTIENNKNNANNDASNDLW